MSSGDDYEVEFRLKRADGTYRWHLGRAVAMRDARGAVSRWFGTNTDIDDRKRAQDELQRRAAYARQLISIVSHDLRNPINAIVVGAALLASADDLNPQSRVNGHPDRHARNAHRRRHRGLQRRRPIPAADIARFFQPFERGEAVLSADRSVGLGLFISRQIVEAHGGTISVESSTEGGTVFRVRLPRVDATTVERMDGQGTRAAD